MANQNKYGLYNLLDLGILDPDQAVGVADSDLLSSAIDFDTARHNAAVNSLKRIFWEDTTEFQLEIQSQTSARNQPLDQNARALPIKGVAPYNIWLPLQGSGNAWGANFLTMELMNVRVLQQTVQTMMRGDLQWVLDHVLGAIFANASWSFRDPVGHGALTIQGLANGDSVTYYSSTTGLVATDTHYFAQAAAIADASNPYPTIWGELKEHPDNGGEVVAYISTSQVAGTTGLAEFRSATLDADIILGDNVTRLNGALTADFLPPYSTLRGKTDSGVWIVEWPMLPSGYMIAVTTQGRRPLGRRLYPLTKLQGFAARGDRSDWPWSETQWNRFEGYGGLNRLGAVVYRTGNGAYAVPTNYTMPMA